MFDINADVLVNTVNCVGVMGKGVALAFKKKYPSMFKQYKQDCQNSFVYPGSVILYKGEDGKLIINFATKDHWRHKSRYCYIEDGLESLKKTLQQQKDGTIVAIPALGCGHGGLDWNIVRRMIAKFLGDLKNVDIHVFQPQDSISIGDG